MYVTMCAHFGLQVFKPPNPWTMAIMNVLAELHQEPELKLNLKFEIEVLCKNLSIDVVVSNCMVMKINVSSIPFSFFKQNIPCD
jgi:hypothetical protein